MYIYALEINLKMFWPKRYLLIVYLPSMDLVHSMTIKFLAFGYFLF